MVFRYTLLFLTVILTTCNVQVEKTDFDNNAPNIVWITSEDNSKHYLKLFDPNGVSTPNIEKLASQGLIFTHAFSNAPVCSVARSAIISGCYGPRIGAQFHRKYKPVPMPKSLQMFPYYLQKAGYFTSNNSKKDYNIIENDSVWNESSGKATWKNRAKNQPFFHVFNIGITHESSLHFSRQNMDTIKTKTDPASFSLPPNHPDTKIFRYSNALYRDKIKEMDIQVGKVIDELAKDNLLDNTFIFYFGDHGGVLPGSKGYLYETGLHVPMVVHIPKNYQHLVENMNNRKVEGFVNFIDLAPTILNLAGVKIPEGMDGQSFLGKDVNLKLVNDRNITFGYADRFDEKYDMVRSVRKGDYKYVRNFQPYHHDALMNNYRYKQLAYQEWEKLHIKGELNDVQSAFFKPKKPEYLFNITSDPYETKNLVNDPNFLTTLQDMRTELNSWIKGMPDLSFYPEYILIDHALSNPIAFGKRHKKEISKYLDVVNLSLSKFNLVEDELIKSLTAVDPWERYWALTAVISFGKKAEKLTPLLLQISKNDPELINRVRGSEFLAIAQDINPSESIINCLYLSKKPTEALLILNAIALMKSSNFGYDFKIESEKINSIVKMDAQVQLRLEFLNGISL